MAEIPIVRKPRNRAAPLIVLLILLLLAAGAWYWWSSQPSTTTTGMTPPQAPEILALEARPVPFTEETA